MHLFYLDADEDIQTQSDPELDALRSEMDGYDMINLIQLAGTPTNVIPYDTSLIDSRPCAHTEDGCDNVEGPTSNWYPLPTEGTNTSKLADAYGELTNCCFCITVAFFLWGKSFRKKALRKL